MCGFSLIFNFDNELSESEKLEFQTKSRKYLSPRGPSEFKHYAKNRFSISFARLSIVGIENGSQPLFDYKSSLLMAMNGEIYNHKKLRVLLEAKGYKFKTDSDAEVILAFESLNFKNYEKLLDGFFSYFIIDIKNNAVKIVRDSQGQKPLYYYLDNSLLYLSSDSRIIPHKKFNKESFSEYNLFSYIPSENTFSDSIFQLTPGHKLTLKSNKEITRIDWAKKNKVRPILGLNKGSKNKSLKYRECLSATKKHLLESVKKRIPDEVSLGIFLSGGIDSALITAITRDLEKELDIYSYTASFGDDDIDGKFSKLIAKKYKTKHKEVNLESKDLIEVFPELVESMPLPIGNPAIFPTFILSRIASKEVPVVFTGGGADELFFGYPTYKVSSLIRRTSYIPQNFKRNLIPFLIKFSHYKSTYSYKRLSQKLISMTYQNLAEAHYYARCWNSVKTNKKYIFKDQRNQNHSPISDFLKRGNNISMEDLSLMDRNNWWRYMGLYSSDIITMGNGLEARMPFMDLTLENFVHNNLPLNFKFGLLKKTKPILRDISCDLLGKDYSKLPKKGFSVPLEKWFKNELNDFLNSFLDIDLKNIEIEKNIKNNLRKLIHQNNNLGINCSYEIFGTIVLIEWLRQNF